MNKVTSVVGNGRKPRRIAPGPGGGIMGNLDAFKRGAVQMLLDLRETYGDVVRNRLGPYLTHCLFHPDYVEHVLASNQPNYVRGRFYDRFRLFFGMGLLTLDGEAWLTHRRITQPLFHKQRIAGMAGSMGECANELVERFGRHAKGGVALDIVPDMMRVSLAVLGKTMFSVDVSRTSDEISTDVALVIEAMMPQTSPIRMLPEWVPIPYNRRIAQARGRLGDVIRGVIRDRRVHPSSAKDDLVTLLVEGKNERGESLAEKEIHDELMTILLAGHETTGTALAWTLYALSTHPDVRRRLRDELDASLGGRAPAFDDLPRLPYLRRVIDESLRVYPPIWAYNRDTVADDEIGGYWIPGRSTIFLSPYVTHRHPAFWTNAEAFDPDRFESNPRPPKYAYFPFGGGQRQCIGSAMAIMTMQILVAALTQHFDVDFVPGHRLKLGNVVSLRPMEGMRMTVRSRTDRATAARARSELVAAAAP